MRMLNIIKRAAMDVNEASVPVGITFGTVVNDNPLEVTVDQRFILDEDFLIIPESMTKYEVDLNCNNPLEGVGDVKSATSDKVVIRTGLEKGDKVLLLRIQGGQQYLVLDKVVGG
ncbi:DUF2577 domain-containing protein [Paenibacillus popilliae]|uniref:DUF2577 domain-containing protein n=2 Tax=Paenibacillus TaxID=44249 RepID=A0ABY3AR91_PAEPP|nr:DUF2577 domain-containing protein [Paenibacillus sp. SDF0028]